MANAGRHLYATGCRRCPMRAEGPSPASPFLMFSPPQDAAYSLPLNAFYLPISPYTDFGQFLGAHVPAEQTLLLTAIVAHEIQGHMSRKRSLGNTCTRFYAVQAYEAIAELMAGKDSWPKLIHWNNAIQRLDDRLSFCDELSATLLGFYSLFHNEGFPVPDDMKEGLKELERQFVDQGVTDFRDSFGNRFDGIYWGFREVCQYVGVDAFKILVMYAQDWPGYLVHILPHNSEKRSGVKEVLQRLENGLMILRYAARSVVNVGKRSPEYWLHVFAQELPGFSQWWEDCSKADAELLKSISDRARVWARDIGGQWNPIVGGEMTVHWGVDIKLFDPRWIKHIGLSVFEGLGDEFSRMAADATAHDRAVVWVGSRIERDDPEWREGWSHLGLCFGWVGGDQERQAAGLTPYIIGLGRKGRRRSTAEEWESAKGEFYVRNCMSALIVFENLRVMVANGRGLWCPMRHVPWPIATDEGTCRPLADEECCGLREHMLRLWKAGRAAGLEWHEPRDCFDRTPLVVQTDPHERIGQP